MSFKVTMRRTWPVLVSYAIFSLWGVFCLIAALFLTHGVAPGEMLATIGIFVAIGVGHLVGNAIGLAGFRLIPITAIFVGMFFGALLAGAALGPFVVYLVVGAFAAYGGYLGIGSRLDVVASWYPLTLCVGAAISWMNAHQAIATFNSGSKHQLWDAFTIVCLGGGVFWMLVFMATRNALGLTVWQEVARPRNVNVEQDDIAVARPGRGSFLVLLAFTVVILGVTALISPYLFRTAQSDGKDNGGQGDKGQNADQQHGDGPFRGKHVKGQGRTDEQDDGDGDGQGKNKTKKGKGKGGKADGQSDDSPDKNKPDPEQAREAAEDAAKLAFKIVAYLLALAAILLLLYLVVLPPLRRAFLMRHLEKPLWPVPPTSRVMNHWRRALAVLAILGIEPSAGETATDFAKRATKEVGDQLSCDAPGLGEAAVVVERIAYAGRGLGAADEQAVREATSRFVDTVRPRIKLRSRFAAAWGRPPEVES